MNVLRLNRVALKALGRNKLRTALAMLGIAIGVGAVVAMVAVGEGASARVRNAMASLGRNMIWVEEGGVRRGGVRTGSRTAGRLTLADAKAIEFNVDLVTNVSPHVDARVQLVYRSLNWNSMVRGVPPQYLAVRQWEVVNGEMFTEQNVRNAANVCVLGQTVWKRLFGSEDPIGKWIRVKNLPCLVVGVLEAKGSSVTGQDQDDTFMMPYTTVMKKINGQTWLDDLMCTAVSAEVVAEAERQITELMRERHRILPGMADDFNLRHPAEIAQLVAESVKTMELLLASIASISLLLGGIGIMNIMLVSVTERTHEIGIRMAVGARGSDIRKQFLLEALFLSLGGGLAGVLLGTVASVVITSTLQWVVRLSLNSILLAFLFSASVGVFFGYYPALKASRLEPINALRFEV